MKIEDLNRTLNQRYFNVLQTNEDLRKKLLLKHFREPIVLTNYYQKVIDHVSLAGVLILALFAVYTAIFH